MFYPRGRGRQWSWKGEKNHFLEESLLIVLLRGRQELPRPRMSPLLGGSTIYSATGGAENPPSMSTGHVVLVFLGASLSLAPGGCVGILEFPQAERGRALELARWMWAQVPAVPLA